jgi:hypothetical protein
VISNHLENEERFRTPEMLAQHGIHRAMNVILQGDGRPFGVLEVDSRSEEEFVEQDLAFLQGAANILGMAIERERHARNLEAALDRHQVLLKEMGHRVKNSLMIVTSMLQLQARDIGDPALTLHLEEAAQRVSAVAKAHDQLLQGADIERMDLGKYVEGICRDLHATVAHCVIHTEAQYEIEFSADRARLRRTCRQRADRKRGEARLPGQVVPRPAVASGERHEAPALQWSVGTNRDEASARAEHRGGTFDVLDIHPLIERRIHQDAVEQADNATIDDQEIVSVDKPPREALLESRGELLIDLDGDAPIQADHVANRRHEGAHAGAGLEDPVRALELGQRDHALGKLR